MSIDNVVHIKDHRPMPASSAPSAQQVKPKTTSHTYAGHRFVLRYDPNAPSTHRWHWTVRFTKTYEFTGTANSIKVAERRAKAQIDQMIEFTQTGA